MTRAGQASKRGAPGPAPARFPARALAFALALTLALAFGLALAPRARAGAWGRLGGKGFVSAGSVVAPYVMPTGQSVPVRREDRVYAELGLGQGWMAQADLSFGAEGARDIVLSLGRALPWHPLGGVMRWSAGLGLRRRAGAPAVRLLRPGVVWGRGLSLGKRSGWLQAEAQVELWQHDAAPKLDLQAGVNLRNRSMLILELQADRYPGAAGKVRLTPSVVIGLGRRTSLQLQPGWTFGPRHDPTLNFALWTEF